MKGNIKALIAASLLAASAGSAPVISATALTGFAGPASICAPAGPDTANKVTLGAEGYRFRHNKKGYATFYCPIPFTDGDAPPLPGWTGDLLIPGAPYIFNYRLAFRDPDEDGSAAQIYSYYWERNRSGVLTFSGYADSNWCAGWICDPGEVLSEVIDEYLGDGHYGLYVVMYRENASLDVVFSGFDLNDTSF